MLRIDKIMKEKDISTQHLAELMQVTPQYVSEVVNERKNITLAVLSKFAQALQVPLASLMDGYQEREHMGFTSFNCPYCGNVISVQKTNK